MEPGYRFDFASPGIGVAPKPVETDENGFNVYRCTFAHGNIVLPYRDSSVPGGVRYEFRSTEELARGISTMVGKPVVLAPKDERGRDIHPEDGMLDPDTAKKYTGGTVLKVWMDGDEARGEFVSHDRALDDAIAAGKYNLSGGYRVTELHEPGETADGQKYHLSQQAPRFNHLLVCDDARSKDKDGRPARITGDANDMQDEENETAGDAGETKTDMLSDQAMALLEQMPEDDRKKVVEMLAKAKSMETSSGDEQMDMSERGDSSEHLLKIVERLASIEDRLQRLDAAPGTKTPQNVRRAPGRAHGTKPKASPQAAEILAQAKAVSEKAVDQRLAEQRKVQRIVGDSGMADSLPATKLAFITRVTPLAKDAAEGAVKAERFDTLDLLFDLACKQVESNRARLDADIEETFGGSIPIHTRAGSGVEFELPEGDAR